MSHTILVKVERTHYDKLSEEFIKLDTETVQGTFYKLPKTDLLILYLNSNGLWWQTIRRATSWKEAYYKKHIGEEVEIVVNT